MANTKLLEAQGFEFGHLIQVDVTKIERRFVHM